MCCTVFCIRAAQTRRGIPMIQCIPTPKQITYGQNECRLAAYQCIEVPKHLCDTVRSALKARFPDAVLTETDDAFRVTLYADQPVPDAPTPAREDEYVLHVTPEGISVRANNPTALDYGVYTLIQLPDTVTECVIRDYPSIPIRMVHLDLKGYLPRFEVLLEEFRMLASYKINAVLLELEDKYCYRCAPEFAAEHAYTYEQMRILSRTAEALHIMIVPKLQSIAHIDYLVRHPKYAHLRDEGNIFQYAPGNPEVKALWEAMCAELMECFAEHDAYFHIGADECSVSPEDYYKRVGDSIEFVRSRGRMPVMWDDILRADSTVLLNGEAHSLRKLLGQRAIFMYWAYGYGGTTEALPYIQTYLDEGFRVWGASGYAGCDNWAGSIPPMKYRANNIDDWTEKAIAYTLECVCATGWTRIASADCPAEPQETSLFPILYSAYSMWSGEKLPYEDFIRTLFPRLYGKEADEQMVNVLMDINGASIDFVDAEKSNGNARLRLLYVAAALEKMADKRNLLLNYFQYYDGKLTNQLEDYRYNLVKGITERTLSELEAAKAETETTYALFYETETVDEIIRTRFGYLFKLANALLQQLTETAFY